MNIETSRPAHRHSQHPSTIRVSRALLTFVAYFLTAGLTIETVQAQVGLDPSQAIHVTRASVGGSVVSEGFGSSLAVGDMDGDGYAELGIGAPRASIFHATDGLQSNAGAAVLLPGMAGGVDLGGAEWFLQPDPDGVHQNDRFGSTVDIIALGVQGAVQGTFAVGAPGQTISTAARGRVDLFRLLPVPSSEAIWPGNGGGPLGTGIQDFGSSIAHGDFHGCDGLLDLAVGNPQSGHSGVGKPGRVVVIEGTFAGLDTPFSFSLTEGDYDPAEAEFEDRFGQVLTSGDFDGNGCDDLAVGVPRETDGTSDRVGAVYVFFGTPTGLVTITPQRISLLDVFTSLPAQPAFAGAALAAGDFDGDGKDDLAVGVPEVDIAGIQGAGAVFVLRGTASGLALPNQPTWLTAANPGTFLRFGSALVAADFTLDGRADLVVGEDPANTTGLPANYRAEVHVFQAGPQGLGSTPTFSIDQQDLGVPTTKSDTFDGFGLSLAAGPIGTPGAPWLAIGAAEQAIGPELGEVDGAGMVYLVPNVAWMLFADGFESGSMSGWTSHVP